MRIYIPAARRAALMLFRRGSDADHARADALSAIGKAIGEYSWHGLSEAAADIARFETAARENNFTTPEKYDSAYNRIMEKMAAIMPEGGTANAH